IIPNATDLDISKRMCHTFRRLQISANDGRVKLVTAVSYTHLRANETLSDLGFRLLLEKRGGGGGGAAPPAPGRPPPRGGAER
ncbi:hypothetical protein, partial [Salmonella enterica]|uniref:hypothetical protein n=1 Tax=Salmonella enterica TaxID=28901 RepID=UPI002892FAEC